MMTIPSLRLATGLSLATFVPSVLIFLAVVPETAGLEMDAAALEDGR